MKKWIGLVAVVAMVLTLGVASAVPSKTTTDIAAKPVVLTTTGAQVSENFTLQQAEDKAPVVIEIAKIVDAVNTQGKAPVEYFPAEVQAAIAEKLPEVANLNALEMNEFVSIATTGYDATYGDVSVAFDVVSNYKAGQKVVALVGVFSGALDANGEFVVEWIPMNATVLADNLVQVDFTGDALTKMQTAYAASLALLSEPV